MNRYCVKKDPVLSRGYYLWDRQAQNFYRALGSETIWRSRKKYNATLLAKDLNECDRYGVQL